MPDTPSQGPPAEEPALHRAARLGEIAEMERLVQEGADVEARADYAVVYGADLRQLTPLMVAARSLDGASVATLQWLLAHGADLQARSKSGRTATWYAAGKGGRGADDAEWRIADDHADRLRCLLDAVLGAPESKPAMQSHLREACDAGDPARVKLLLARGRSPHGETRAQGLSSRQMPLFCAARSGSVECVRALLEAGADPNQVASDGETALFAARSAAIVKVLVEAGARLDAKDNLGSDVLSVLLPETTSAEARATNGDPVAVLIEAGLDPFVVAAWPHSRLSQEAFRRNADAVAYLLDLGAPITPPLGAPTALEQICWQSDAGDELDENIARIIDLLVNAGASPDGVSGDDHDGWRNPLLKAVDGDGDNPTAVETLLKHGARPDATDRHGQTPLIYAANDGALRSVRALLEAGADPTRRDSMGRSCLDLARAKVDYWVKARRGEAEQTGESTRAFHTGQLRQAEETVRLLEEALRKRCETP